MRGVVPSSTLPRHSLHHIAANLWVLPVDKDYKFSGVGVDEVPGLELGGVDALDAPADKLPQLIQSPWEGVGDDDTRALP